MGERHSRSQQLNARLKANLQIVNTLAVEREIYQVEVPKAAEDEALVHGRVVDENGRGIAGLVVCLVDECGTPIRDVEGSTTDTTGYYAITLDPDLTDRVCEKHKTGIFLAVFTSKGQLLYRQPRPLALTKGARLVVGVSLNRDDLSEVEGSGKPPEPKTVIVPDLIGHTEAEAIETIQSAGLTVGQRQTKLAPDQVGLVLAQDPKAGTEGSSRYRS